MSSVKSVKPFCKVCFDAGKSEAEYSSHFVKSERGRNGKVVCPTLLNLNCTYCHKKGHTKSYCLELKNDKKRSEKAFKRSEFAMKPKKEIKKVEKKNVFAALDSESESEGEEDYPEEFPALSANVTIREHQKKVSFAEMAMKPAVVAAVVGPVVAIAAEVKEEVEVPTEPRQQRMPMRSWAEWSDSESDEEDEFEANGYKESKGYQGYVEETDW